MSLYFDEEDAVDQLRERGYRVVKVEFPNTVTTIKDLIEYFYARRLYYNSNRPFPISRNFEEDKKYVSVLVKKRQAMGLSRKNAIKEAAMRRGCSTSDGGSIRDTGIGGTASSTEMRGTPASVAEANGSMADTRPAGNKSAPGG